MLQGSKFCPARERRPQWRPARAGSCQLSRLWSPPFQRPDRAAAYCG